MFGRAMSVVFAMTLALTATAVLAYNEKIPDVALQAGPTQNNQPLRHLRYAPNNRLANFEEMGMDDQLASDTAAQIDKLGPVRKRLAKLLADQALEVGDAFCPNSGGLPQPYAAMRLLVVQEAGDREVVDASNALFAFEDQAWFSEEAAVQAVYNALERTQNRRQDATLMGVAAVLSMNTKDAVTRRGPWSEGLFGFGGGWSTLEGEVPSLRQKTIEYFALMHLLVEIANQPDGICAS